MDGWMDGCIQMDGWMDDGWLSAAPAAINQRSADGSPPPRTGSCNSRQQLGLDPAAGARGGPPFQALKLNPATKWWTSDPAWTLGLPAGAPEARVCHDDAGTFTPKRDATQPFGGSDGRGGRNRWSGRPEPACAKTCCHPDPLRGQRRGVGQWGAVRHL